MPTLTEDDLYRASTQYRLWSFTSESLASLRSTTNATAADGVRAAIHNLHSQKAGTSNGGPTPAEVDCLTVEEEQKLVGYYCFKMMGIADSSKFPTNVKATAVQYMKRFYLSNSPMTYHPKEIMFTALFLSTKTENCYISLSTFASQIPKATAENIIAPEFLLTQGLRFTFDVRHPFRGSEGGYMELLTLANGHPDITSANAASAEQLQMDMMHLEPANGKSKSQTTAGELRERLERSKARAKDILKTSALLTDSYLLYTPSQIWLAASLLADETLTLFYLDFKFPTPHPLKIKLLSTVRACSKLLLSSPSANPGEAEMNELRRIDKKLYMCRNPEKIDLISINKAQKREGAESGLDEKVIKKRKLEREKSEKEAEDVFGPPLAPKR